MQKGLTIVWICMAVCCLPACQKQKVQVQEQTIENKTVLEQVFCQSCAMPMASDEQFGTNADGSRNTDYCVYCYKDGAFTQDISMEEMIEHCAQFIDEYNKDSEQQLTKEEVLAQMREYFPYLKRWQRE